MRCQGRFFCAAMSCVALVGVLGLSACSGDARSLEEAVEANQLNLSTLSIVPPSGTVEPFYNVSEQVSFGLSGTNTSGTTVTVPNTDRRWSVSDEQVATISENGVLQTLANGVTDVSVRVGGVVAPGYQITVSNADLSAIESIVGDDSVERCIPASYSAVGTYSDGSSRGLQAVSWSLGADNPAELITGSDGAVLLNALNVGAVNLVAQVEQESLTKTITIADTLTSILLSPTDATLAVDDTLDFSATGNYTKADGSSRTEVITANVDWTIPSSDGYAELNGVPSTVAEIEGIEAGSTTVTVSCGDLSVVTALTVEDDSSDGFSFKDESPLIVTLSGGTYDLEISSGTVYTTDDDSDITDDAEWEVITGTANLTVNNGTLKGRITPLQVGFSTVEVTWGDYSKTLSVEVRE